MTRPSALTSPASSAPPPPSRTTPGLSRVPLVGMLERLPAPLESHAHDGLAAAPPAARLGFLARDVVPLTRVAHGQDEIGVDGGLAPGRGEGGMEAHQALVGEHVD